ncbi:MAG: DNA-binding response regulator [Actinobacteria bacterium]|nr:DNA-binding response regulator [Actinomycetota bacterium]NBO35146.1 DNA-binding response regulator [Actinomycetota bacterium]
MQTPRILVVEDDAFTRTSIVGALASNGIDVIDSVATSAEAVSSFEKHKPDVVLLDLDLGYGPTGLDLARAFRLRNPNIGLVMLTTYSDPRLLRANLPAIPAGTEYLVKSNIGEIKIVSDAIKLAINYSSNSSNKIKQARNDIPRDLQGMTDIQIETLRMVAQGHTNSEIAKQRFVSEKAVEQTIAKIAKALDIPAATNQNQRVHIARVYFRLTGQGNL